MLIYRDVFKRKWTFGKCDKRGSGAAHRPRFTCSNASAATLQLSAARAARRTGSAERQRAAPIGQRTQIIAPRHARVKRACGGEARLCQAQPDLKERRKPFR